MAARVPNQHAHVTPKDARCSRAKVSHDRNKIFIMKRNQVPSHDRMYEAGEDDRIGCINRAEGARKIFRYPIFLGLI